MVVAAVDHGEIDGQFAKGFGGIETSETAADDDDLMSVH